MASTVSTHFRFNLPRLPHAPPSTSLHLVIVRTRRRPHPSLSSISRPYRPNPNYASPLSVVARASSDGGGSTTGAGPQQSAASEETKSSTRSYVGGSYVPVFVRMLGLDKDPEEREQGVVALWHYSLGGKKCVDDIMLFKDCLNLIVNLLKSESKSASEAAAGLLQTISSIDVYRDSVAESGATEEIASLLSHSSLPYEVKEQSLCTLWNLSVDEKVRVKIVNADVLPLLVKFLDNEPIRVRRAAVEVLANLALSHSNHNAMVEEGLIPKLAKLLTTEEGFSGFRRKGMDIELDEDVRSFKKEARNVLLELARDEYYKILVIEEGLVPVPLIGAATYKSFRPEWHPRPVFPDGEEVKKTYKNPSTSGAPDVLLGLNVDRKAAKIDKAKENAMIGWSRQQFLARNEVTESEYDEYSHSRNQQFNFLPWVDGVARLVLILELDDDSAISRAAKAIADASINEHMRTSFRYAGAVRHLIRLLDSTSEAVRLASICALDKLCVSNTVCQDIEAKGALHTLVNIVKNSESSGNMLPKVLNILTRILDPSKAMKSKLCDGSVDGSPEAMDAKMLNFRNDVLDSGFVSCLVEVLKTASPDLQAKGASVLEFVTVIDSGVDTIISVDIQSGLCALFQQNIFNDKESDMEGDQPEVYALKVEEAGIAVSAGARLLTKLLDHEKFCQTMDSLQLTGLLRELLKSNIRLQSKEWISACLVKLKNLTEPHSTSESAISLDVALYETIPRLVEQMKTSFSPEKQEAAVVELNRIVSEGPAETTQALACNGGIFPVIKLLEEGSDTAKEASLSLLYNLSMDIENHPTIIAAGAVPILRRIITTEKPQWERALHLLRTLPV